MYEEEFSHQMEQPRDPLHTLCPRKRHIHHDVTPLLNDAHRKLTRTHSQHTNTYGTRAFTLSALEDVLHRLIDTAPGDDTVCYSIIKNAPLATRHFFLRLISQSFSEGRLPTRWKMAKIIPHHPILLLPERLVVARVKWSAQPIDSYSLGFRSGVGTIDVIATLIHTAAPITTLRRGYKSCLATIFLDLEKHLN